MNGDEIELNDALGASDKVIDSTSSVIPTT